ncbi:Arc family DNA-binding protein [Pseudomonas sp. NA-150]|uniref:Arc family DNA-binding protein n=1 Tax=Pseudomonas sp. NA-150 TaxID=3367525 RepID=UPI0037C552D9
MQKKQKQSYPLRLESDTRGKAESEARSHHRSLNVELGLLIEDGLKWRKMQSKQAVA